MSRKITKLKFIEAIENNEDGLTNKELAAKLGISEVYFYQLRKRHREEIRDYAAEMAMGLAIEQVQNLRRNSRKGDSRAATILLEMAGSYLPRAKFDVTARNNDIDFAEKLRRAGARVKKNN